MAISTDMLALLFALVSAICAAGYLLGAVSHRMTTGQGDAPIDEAGDPLGFRAIMVFQANGAILFAAAALLISLSRVALRDLPI